MHRQPNVGIGLTLARLKLHVESRPMMMSASAHPRIDPLNFRQRARGRATQKLDTS